MLQKLANTRLHAFLIHLSLSALIAFTVILAAVLIWYPDYLIDATGAKKIFWMIIGIDVCIGPILTFVVFDKEKGDKKLSRDLASIFAVQVIALVYGMYTVTVARPVYMVYAVDRFELVQANEISSQNLNNATQEEFKKLPWLSPQWVSALMPDDTEEQNDILFNAIDTGADLAQLPKYYADYSFSVGEIIKRALPLKELIDKNKDKSSEVKALLEKYPDESKFGFLPMSARKQHLSVVVNLNTGQPIEISALSPW